MQEHKPKLLVIIPAFNEEANVGAVVRDVRESVPDADIVVIDDGSDDATAAAAGRAGANVLRLPYNMGIGAAMQTGYRYASLGGYDVAVQVDADGQHPADEITRLAGPVLTGMADMAVGSRFLSDGNYRPSLARSAGMSIFSRVVSAIIKVRMTDTTSGFRAAGKRCIAYFSRHYPDDYPEVEALVLLHRMGFSIMEVPVTMRRRSGGQSSITPARSVYYMIKVLLAIFVDLLKKAG